MGRAAAVLKTRQLQLLAALLLLLFKCTAASLPGSSALPAFSELQLENTQLGRPIMAMGRQLSCKLARARGGGSGRICSRPQVYLLK